MFASYFIDSIGGLPNSGPRSRRSPHSTKAYAEKVSEPQKEVKVPPPPEKPDIEVDVLIVGSGPIGCAFARSLLDPPQALGDAQRWVKPRVLMVDVGQYLSNVPGENIKNSFYYQRNVNQFTPVVQGTLQPISIAPDSQGLPYPADPSVFHPHGRSFIINNINPDQAPETNLPAAATTYAVGGMATHWTCCIPRTSEQEVPSVISKEEWAKLYPVAEQYFDLTPDIFKDSLRQQVIRERLEKKYPNRAKPMPIAGHLSKNNPALVVWAGSDTVLGPLVKTINAEGGNLTLLQQHRATYLITVATPDGKKEVTGALVDDLQGNRRLYVKAKVVVVACNPILTPQLLFNSNLGNEALGRYLMDQPMTFCQVLLSKNLVEDVASRRPPPSVDPTDPVPIPIKDLPPAMLLKYTDDKPWHVQIHKDTFSYGMVPQSLDPRLVLDIRYFGRMEPSPLNRVSFSTKNRDLMGMPQPTFHFSLSEADADLQHKMMVEMVEVANYLGGFLPGAEPRCMPWGTSLHFQGTTRIGKEDDGTSVCDVHSLVWKTTNLFVGGNGCIPTSIACNPTLTAVCLAVKASHHILDTFFVKPVKPAEASAQH